MFKKIVIRPEEAPTAFQWGVCPNCPPGESDIRWEGEEREHNEFVHSNIQHYYCRNCHCYIDTGQLSRIEENASTMMSKLDLISRSVKRIFRRKKLKSNYLPLGGPVKRTDAKVMPTIDDLHNCPICGSDDLLFDPTAEDYYPMDTMIEWVKLADCGNCLAGIEQNQELPLEDLTLHEITKLELIEAGKHESAPYIRVKY